MDVRSFEERENTLALLKILALGQHEIAKGHYRDAFDVFADLERVDLP
jgi:hypothetical protein